MKTKSTTLIAVLMLVSMILIEACMVATPTPNPTEPPQPTSTPAPTDTPQPTPTATRTPAPTFTPEPTKNVKATAAAMATGVAAGVLDELDKVLSDTGIPYTEGTLVWAQEQTVYIDLDKPGWRYFNIADVTVSDFILKSDITWETTGLILCGTMFRVEQQNFTQGKQYQFLYLRFSGLPAWAIEFHKFGEFQNTITDIKFSNAINLDNRATNQVILVAQGNEFTVFINGIRQGRFFDYSKQAAEGGVAFIAGEDSGQSTCTFENSYIWSLPSQ